MTADVGWFVTPIPWLYVGGVRVYALLWMRVEDEAKRRVYRWLEREPLQTQTPPAQKSETPASKPRHAPQAGSH